MNRLYLRTMIVLVAVLSFAPVTFADTHKAGDVELEPGKREWRGQSFDVDYGTLWVPMNREDPGSKLIRLKFIRFRSTAATPGHPMVYLTGGPGGSGIGTLNFGRARVFLSYLDIGDYIAFDQRGTGESEPDTRCDPGHPLPLDQPGDPELYAPIYKQRAMTALEAMAERGVDIRGLTTEQSADDLEDLRRALGAEKLVLWGSSYGTHLACSMARRHPGSVDRMILAGTEGPDHSYKLPSNIQTNLERLAALVAEDPVYREKMPDMLGTLRTLLDDLEANPRTVSVVPGMDIVVGKWDLQSSLASGMGSRTAMSRMPAQLYAMSHGEFFDLAREVYGDRMATHGGLAMSLAMDCASYATRERLERIEREAGETLLGATIDFPYPGWCDVEGMPRLDDNFRSTLRADMPVLFVSGTLDGRTPISNAREIAKGFPNSHHLIVERASHGGDLFTSTPVILETVRAFARGEPVGDRTIEGPEWQFTPPYERSLAAELLRMLVTQGYDVTEAHYRDIRTKHDGKYVYDFSEAPLNAFGYGLMRAGMIDAAIGIFRINTVGYPESANTWDSLGEGYMKKGEFETAIAFYEKSLALDSGNENARTMIQKMRAEMSRK
jgi:pimeloyl-ACP methyl ester carboxylesterase